MRARPNIIPGTTLNRLTILSRAPDLINHRGCKTRMVVVRCACGTEKTIRAAAFFSQHLKSCGCLKVEKFIARSTKHGHCVGGKSSKAFHAWHDAKQRCHQGASVQYASYGGRGITVCAEWRYDFSAFLEHMGEPPTDDLSLDRIDVNGNYEPGNCRWATRTEQARNTRTNRFIDFNGERKTIAEWSVKTGLSPSAIWHRVNAGWATDDALSKPSLRGKVKL